jgi:hypothetical protein
MKTELRKEERTNIKQNSSLKMEREQCKERINQMVL